ncbi:hypothetical protein ACRALDRAFT_2025313 [Sodiomyces alcalophilus JCM 7366]|uniref:uncharacterized protein n=1 Tax=Sodiomyces alcalophilus JCM 7366 TaxID=591952 RepID=UPI0039B6AD38
MLRLPAVLVLALWAAARPSCANQIPQLAIELLFTIDASESQLTDVLVPEIGANSSVMPAMDMASNGLGPLALMPRQSQCDPGYYLCSTSTWCCPNGDTCVPPRNCCPGNRRKCSATSCYDPSSEKCCSDYIVCPIGWDCVGGGCCPAGQKRCGNSKCYDPNTQTCCTGPGTVWACGRSQECCPNGYCRNPNTQTCCERGACDNDTTCCRHQCCYSHGYCASDGYCQTCPIPTTTSTATMTFNTAVYHTVTSTSDPAPQTNNAPLFTCVPMTATNTEGATLELAKNCALKYNPPTTITAAAAAVLAREPDPDTTPAPNALLPRQAGCTPFMTYTSIVWATRTTTTTLTRSTTISGPGHGRGFSCPEMKATNAAGDVLAMGKSCVLSFTAAADQGGGPTGPTGGAGLPWSSAVAMRTWAVVAACVVYVMM